MDTRDHACDLPDRERLLLAYLRGTISPEDGDRFEAHCMSCDECAAELELGVRIRAALAPTEGSAPGLDVGSAKTVRRTRWTWVAAAASVLLVVSVWRLSLRQSPVVEPLLPSPAPTSGPPPTPAPSPVVVPPTPPVRPSPSTGTGDRTLRTPSANDLRPVAKREVAGQIRIDWSPVKTAIRYVVTIFGSDGVPLLRQEIATTSIVIDASTGALAARANDSLRGRVDAIDALGVAVATSPFFTIPNLRQEAP